MDLDFLLGFFFPPLELGLWALLLWCYDYRILLSDLFKFIHLNIYYILIKVVLN